MVTNQADENFAFDYIYAGGARLPVAGLVAAGIVLQVGSHLWQSELDFVALDSQRVVVDAVAVVLVLAVLGYVVVSMFPAAIVQTGSTTNIIAHAVGFLLGVGCSVAIKRDGPEVEYLQDE